jgi:phage-related protein
MWKVRFYQTTRGERPVENFIRKQDEATYARVLHSIILLRDGGPYLRPPQIKKLQKGLFEVRVRGKINIRIFYTMYKNEYWLIHAFKKKSQKTPRKEIKTALDRIKESI